jgi:hypothetical protein
MVFDKWLLVYGLDIDIDIDELITLLDNMIVVIKP